MKGTDAFTQTIKKYLQERGRKDPLFAKILTKQGKNMEGCISYILETVQKSGCNGFEDDEIYNMAIHYFDEDDISVGSMRNCNVVVNHVVEFTEEEKEKARKEAYDKVMKQEMERLTRKPEKKTSDKKEETKSNTLF